MSLPKEKFSSQADPKLLKSIRKLAKTEGRQLHSLIDEAFSDLLEKRNGAAPRAGVMELYGKSLTNYESLYKRLAE
jgi:hypothetical protein